MENDAENSDFHFQSLMIDYCLAIYEMLGMNTRIIEDIRATIHADLVREFLEPEIRPRATTEKDL